MIDKLAGRAPIHLGVRRRLRALHDWVRDRSPEPIRSVTYLGHPFAYPATSQIGRAVAAGTQWDSVLHRILTSLTDKDDPLLCDVGANIGATLLQMLAAKPAARAIAFEPSNRFRKILRRNLKSAGRQDVDVRSLFLGASNGRIRLYNNSSTASAVSANYDGHLPRGTQRVDMTTLDAALAGSGCVDLIKIDTDGFDFEVLRGAENILRTDQPIVFFELATYLLKDPTADLTWLQQRGYRDFVCFSPLGEPIGATSDAQQAIRWSISTSHCNVLSCASDSPAGTSGFAARWTTPLAQAPVAK